MIGLAQFNYSTLVHTLQWLKGNDMPFVALDILIREGHSGLYCSRFSVVLLQKCLFLFEEKVFSGKH